VLTSIFQQMHCACCLTGDLIAIAVTSVRSGGKGKFRGSDEEIEQCQEELKKIGKI
jgi:hypothetical protein